VKRLRGGGDGNRGTRVVVMTDKEARAGSDRRADVLRTTSGKDRPAFKPAAPIRLHNESQRVGHTFRFVCREGVEWTRDETTSRQDNNRREISRHKPLTHGRKRPKDIRPEMLILPFSACRQRGLIGAFSRQSKSCREPPSHGHPWPSMITIRSSFIVLA